MDSGSSGLKDFILCMAFLFSVLWVISLKVQITDMQKKLAALAEKLKRFVKGSSSDVEVSKDQEVFGKKPPWAK